MATSQNNNNTLKTVTFSAADFQRWNQTTSVVSIPQRLIRLSKIPQLRKELIQSVGERKVAAVQALSPFKYRIEFRRSSDRHAADINRISFRGIHLQPLPAYEEVKSIFVDRAPLQMQDNILFETLAPYGRVISIQHLKVKGFESVRSGTRRVSMVLTKAIPATINIGGFSVSFRYRGQPPTCFVCQEVGHETHSPSHESARRWFANSGYRVASSSLTSKSAGVAILVKDTYKITKIIKDEDGRYVQAVVDFKEGQASFVSLYAPNRNPACNVFFAQLTGLMDLSRPTFVAGDFNSVLDPAKDRMRDPSYVAGPAAQQRESILHWSPSCRSRKRTRCGASSILGAQHTPGRMGTVPMRRESTWCGLQLHYPITSRGVSTIHPSLATTNIYWWNLIYNSKLSRGRGCAS